jgi:tetratricopeptide (TPR) repeat protein
MAISKLIPALLLAWSAVFSIAQASTPAAQPRSAPRPHPSPAEQRSSDDLKDAEDLLQKQQYAQAEEKLLALTAKNKDNPQVWFDLGFAQSHLGKTADSVAAYKKSVELSPKWFEAQQNLGLALAKSGDFPAAAVELKIAVTLKPTTGGEKALSQAWLSLAQLTEQNQPQEALAAYQKAVELDSTNVEAALGAALLTEHSGNLGAAEQQYSKLAELGNENAIERLVGIYIEQKRYADAEGWLRKYLLAHPGATPAQFQLGKLLLAQGKTQEAISTLDSAYNASPDPRIAQALAELYLQTKNYEPAARLLQPLTTQSPNDPQLHLDFGSALVHQHKYPEAQAELLKAVQLKPSLTEAYFDLAYAAQQNKNYELTIRVLDARAKLEPETPATYFLRAEAYDSLRMYKPAAENYKLFLAAAGGKYPDQEFQARHRLKAILPN